MVARCGRCRCGPSSLPAHIGPLRKVYDAGSVHVDALQGVDLAVEAGEMLATTYLPARRASRVYPAEALRYQ